MRYRRRHTSVPRREKLTPEQEMLLRVMNRCRTFVDIMSAGIEKQLGDCYTTEEKENVILYFVRDYMVPALEQLVGAEADFEVSLKKGKSKMAKTSKSKTKTKTKTNKKRENN